MSAQPKKPGYPEPTELMRRPKTAAGAEPPGYDFVLSTALAMANNRTWEYYIRLLRHKRKNTDAATLSKTMKPAFVLEPNWETVHEVYERWEKSIFKNYVKKQRDLQIVPPGSRNETLDPKSNRVITGEGLLIQLILMECLTEEELNHKYWNNPNARKYYGP